MEVAAGLARGVLPGSREWLLRKLVRAVVAGEHCETIVAVGPPLALPERELENLTEEGKRYEVSYVKVVAEHLVRHRKAAETDRRRREVERLGQELCMQGAPLV
jgi:hypothetical protein